MTPSVPLSVPVVPWSRVLRALDAAREARYRERDAALSTLIARQRAHARCECTGCRSDRRRRS